MKTDIFHLQIVSVEDIAPQEEFDQSRTYPLKEKIKKDGFFSNPIIVAQIDGKKYLQLDGMNRFSSMKILGYRSILTQIVDYNDQENVELSSWAHFFHAEKDLFLKDVEKISGLSLERGTSKDVGHRYIKEEGIGRLCTLIGRSGDVFLVVANGKLVEKVEKMSALVKLYSTRIVRDVLPARPNKSDVDLLFAEHPETNMMCVFPTLTRHQIVKVVKKGSLLPQGVSRHIIKRRCMNVNIPLSLFDNGKNIEEQNQKLEEMLGKRKFRLYEEPTIYFE